MERGVRPEWDIDRRLRSLLGEQVRVFADAFSLESRHSGTPLRDTRSLVLPDGSRAEGDKVFFEGKLEDFWRMAGVVFVQLGNREIDDPAPESRVNFRARVALIVAGPAVMRLGYPFQIERLPHSSQNYWADLRVPNVQFCFPF